MKILDLINESYESFLFEAQKFAPNSEESLKQVRALKKKFNFDANLTVWDNYNKVPEKYREQVIDILINHCKNLNREIYLYISGKYNLGTIYWKKADKSISQYTYIVLRNGNRLGIRISDHSKPKKMDVKTHLMNIYYNTSFNDVVKEKIDNFIKKYSEEINYKKSA